MSRWARMAVTMALCGGLTGCWSSAPAPGPVVAPTPKAQPPVQAAAVKPAAKKAAPKAAAAKTALAFPDAGPDEVLLAGSDGPNVEVVGPAPRFDDADRLTVESGNPAAGSQLLAVQVATAPAGAPRAGVKLPDGFTAEPAYGYTNDGYPLRIRCNKDQSLMAFVPAGVARVGANDGPIEAAPEFVAFTDPFYMDVTEVTIRQFNQYRDELRDQKKRSPNPPMNESAGDSHPALGIPWGDAKNYCRWAGKDLPTEAEFEKAGRGSEGFRAPWGNGRPLWGRPRTPSTITAVGQYRGDISPFGIHDLAGNAREWVEDYFTPGHQEAVQTATLRTLTNWTGPRRAATGTQRVIKGNGPDWALWHRSGADMSQRLPDVGFRGVLRIKPDTGDDATKKAT